ncbi:MAG: hypothetical protein KIT83_20910 [Bryobacterales bacterium]|nr:hypothetical protein [Bryobacterales bacterium]
MPRLDPGWVVSRSIGRERPKGRPIPSRLDEVTIYLIGVVRPDLRGKVPNVTEPDAELSATKTVNSRQYVRQRESSSRGRPKSFKVEAAPEWADTTMIVVQGVLRGG